MNFTAKKNKEKIHQDAHDKMPLKAFYQRKRRSSPASKEAAAAAASRWERVPEAESETIVELERKTNLVGSTNKKNFHGV